MRAGHGMLLASGAGCPVIDLGKLRFGVAYSYAENERIFPQKACPGLDPGQSAGFAKRKCDRYRI